MLNNDICLSSLSQLKSIENINSSGLNKEIAFKICKNSWQNDKQSGLQILQLWSTKLLNSFIHNDFSRSDWLELIKCLKDIYNYMIKINPSENSAMISELENWFIGCIEFMQCIKNIFADFNTTITCCIVFSFFTNTIMLFILFYEKWHIEYNLNEHLKLASALHIEFVKIINKHIDQLSVANEVDFCNLSEFCLSMCHLGERVEMFGLKCTIETWKFIAKLLMHLSKFLEFMKNEQPKQWLERPLQYLICEIERNIKFVYQEETLKQSLEQVDRYLKITNFHTKLLCMLAAKFKHQYFPIAKQFFDVLSYTESMPSVIEASPVGNLVNKYVLSSLNEIFLLLYQNEQLVQMIHTRPNKNYVLISKYLYGVIIDRDYDFIEYNTCSFEKLFKNLFNDSSWFVECSHYDSIIEYYATILYLSKSSKLKNFFIRNVFDDDFIVAFTSVEVLLIYSRCLHQYEQYKILLSDFRFWRQCNESFVLFTNNRKQLFVQRLLKQHFQLCQSSMDNHIHTKDLWDLFPENQIGPNSYKFHMNIGLCHTIQNEDSLKMHTFKLSDKLSEYLKSMSEHRRISKDNYYQTIAIIKLLISSKLPVKCDLLEIIIKLLQGLCNERNGNPNCRLFINACMALLTANFNEINETLLLIVLECIRDSLFGEKSTLKISESLVLDCLNACSKSSNFKIQYTAKNILNNLCKENELVMKLNALDTDNVDKYSWAVVTTGQHMYKLTHECITCKNSKDSTLANGSDIKKVIKGLLSESTYLLNNSRLLDSDDIIKISNAVQSLNKCIN